MLNQAKVEAKAEAEVKVKAKAKAKAEKEGGFQIYCLDINQKPALTRNLKPFFQPET